MPSSRPFEGSPCARVAVSECSPFSFHFCVLLSLSFNHAAAASAALGDSSRNGSKRRKRGELSIRGRRKWRGGRDRTNDICRDGYTHNMLEHEDVFEIVSSPAIARRGERGFTPRYACLGWIASSLENGSRHRLLSILDPFLPRRRQKTFLLPRWGVPRNTIDFKGVNWVSPRGGRKGRTSAHRDSTRKTFSPMGDKGREGKGEEESEAKQSKLPSTDGPAGRRRRPAVT